MIVFVSFRRIVSLAENRAASGCEPEAVQHKAPLLRAFVRIVCKYNTGDAGDAGHAGAAYSVQAGKGMEKSEIQGVAPQKSSTTAPGVSLTHPERAFLARLTDPFADSDNDEADLLRLGQAALLRAEDILFIREWVLCQGVHWLSCVEAGLSQLEGARVFRNPVVRRIINAAAEQGYCVGTSAMKEELEDYFSQRIRNPFLPEAIRDNAADKLAKLKGFYPDGAGKGGGQANVQINFINPYAKSEVSVREAD